MRYNVTWTRTTTFRSEIDLSPAELAGWATTEVNGKLMAHAQEDLAGSSAAQLEQLLIRNHHLRDRLLALYLERTSPPTIEANDQLHVVDVDPDTLNHVDEQPKER